MSVGWESRAEMEAETNLLEEKEKQTEIDCEEREKINSDFGSMADWRAREESSAQWAEIQVVS